MQRRVQNTFLMLFAIIYCRYKRAVATEELFRSAPHRDRLLLRVQVLIGVCLYVTLVSTCESLDSDSCTKWSDVTVVKIGGSSLTDKATRETLNATSLDWFARTLATHISNDFQMDHLETASCPDAHAESSTFNASGASAFIVVHGAGSFGHHSAKEYGIQGYDPKKKVNNSHLSVVDHKKRKKILLGLAQTRRSVQLLNSHVVKALLRYGINAIGISPCFGIVSTLPTTHPSLETTISVLRDAIYSTLRAGLIPVLHGDACLLDSSLNQHRSILPEILSGDTILEWIGSAPWVTRAVFVTDVDGVFTSDPKNDPSARLLHHIGVNPSTGNLMLAENVEVSGSTYEHDVTGGLKMKLAAATSIASTGKNVMIARSGTVTAEQALAGNTILARGTVMYPIEV